MITSGSSLTTSAARAPYRSALPSAYRYSTDDILAFDIAQFTQALPETLDRVGPNGTGRRAKSSNPRHLPRRLRLGGERRGEEATRQAADERPPVHHSIT